MSALEVCHVCGRNDVEPLEVGEVKFHINRYDWGGYFDDVDICSPTCLATLAVITSRHLGASDQRVTSQAAEADETTKRKFWWRR